MCCNVVLFGVFDLFLDFESFTCGMLDVSMLMFGCFEF